MSVSNELPNFNSNLLDYCLFYGINDLDERNMLSIGLSELRKIEVNTQE